MVMMMVIYCNTHNHSSISQRFGTMYFTLYDSCQNYPEICRISKELRRGYIAVVVGVDALSQDWVRYPESNFAK